MNKQNLLPNDVEKSQVRALLRSHSPPPSHLASTISTISEQLARYENEIPRLRAQLEQAEADCAALKEHYDAVRSLLAPIRRLPSEVLVQIFRGCEDPPDEDPDTVEPATEDPDSSLHNQMARLARQPLLTLSQVCIRWHGIVMGTPTLWDTIQLDYTDLWYTEHCVKTALGLLKLALERSKNAPLNFSICIIDNEMDSSGALKLLAQHCERRKTALFFCHPSDFRHHSVRGRLPLLETLELEAHNFEVADASDLVQPFEIAPRLRTFTFGGPHLPTLPAAHFANLRTFGYLGQDPSRIPGAVAFMSRMPQAMEFQLQLFLSNWTLDDSPSIGILPTSSDILTLSLGIRDYFSREQSVLGFDEIFTNLTLPHLRNLKFQSENAPLSVIYWSHSAFMGFAARSSFQTHLDRLSLSNVVIAEAELVDALAVLPLLQHLDIADHRIIGRNGAEQLLITDSLFSALTLKPEPHTPRLVPLLRSFYCQTLLQFDDHTYLNFLLSRREPLLAPVPFISRMYWRPGHRRPLDAGVVARIRELCIRKELVCEFLCADFWSKVSI